MGNYLRKKTCNEQCQDLVKKLNIRHCQNFSEHVELWVSQTPLKDQRSFDIIQIIRLAMNFYFPCFRTHGGGYTNVLCWVYSVKLADDTCMFLWGIHGQWEGGPGSWLSKQISAVHTDCGTWIRACFATFLGYMLEHSELYLLPQFPRYHGRPLPVRSKHILSLY